MTCPNCGGTMIGDGYTSVRHCENVDVPEDLEPDAPPVYCPASQSASVSAEKRLHTPGAGLFNKRGADRLAYACARQILAGRIDSRSAIGDALLDYLEVGDIRGPKDVPSWMTEYERNRA